MTKKTHNERQDDFKGMENVIIAFILNPIVVFIINNVFKFKKRGEKKYFKVL